MPSYTHGGDICSAQAQYGGAVLDFSANLNPLGMPDCVRAAAEASISSAVHYPDPLCRALTAAIARHDGVRPAQILCGNGAADLIFRLAFAQKPRHALVTAPTFSEYAQALALVDCAVAHHVLLPEEHFNLTDAILPQITETLDMLFLCTPNNPTGRLIEAGLMERILTRCAAQNVLLVVDECFLELTEGTGLAGYLEQFPNLFLLRAFTKSYALPGLRLGYGLTGNGALLEALGRCAQPWSVSTPAQAAGLAALGLAVYLGEANYLLFRAAGICDLKERLLPKGILIRACANYVGLGDDYYRVCVRTGDENKRLLAALEEVL